jgi:TetR/AcrR family transcriptional repressor of lmrAB and yxaGH operons
MEMAAKPRERLIETAMRLFQAQGYNQTGLNQIIKESGTPKGSLYHYFPEGKEDLACAAIDHAAQQVTLDLIKATVGVTDLSGLLYAVFGHFINELESSQFTKGCPVATITLEQSSSSERIRIACEQAYTQWIQGLSQVLSILGVAYAERIATYILSNVEGALILSRSRRSAQPLQAVLESLIQSSAYWRDDT